MTTPLHLVMLAGGRGLRAAGSDETPKQFRMTPRGALFAVGLPGFLKSRDGASWHLASLTITAALAWHELIAGELANFSRPWRLAEPGDTRTASTWSALCALQEADAPAPGDLVAIHDAARPFATAELLDALAVSAGEHGGAIPGIPVADTIVAKDEGAARYLNRRDLLAVQTPQVFRWERLYEAHKWAHESGESFTDDGGLLAARGMGPEVVAGDSGNWKVTTHEDWERARDLLR